MDDANAFVKTYPIRFSHCDPAGIVFFPQYLVMLNQLVEDWFNEALGIPYVEMIGSRGYGLPIVRLECDFRAISRMGETLKFSLFPQRVGQKSLNLNFKVYQGDEVRMTSKQVLVFTRLETHGSVAIPDDVRARLQQLYGAENHNN